MESLLRLFDMMTVKQHKFGKIFTAVYDFPEIDDVLPMHNHTEVDVHFSIVARGSFRIHGDGWEIISKAGDIVDWEAGKAHEFIALEPNSRLINIPKNI
jgi:quercetin dioxygenase-like cupin family protein